MATKQKENTLRVGALVTSAAVVLMVFLFFIGSEQKIFSRKNEYKVRLDTVAGLAEGNPVKISGVTVGVVKDIYLPGDPKQKDVDITLMVARKYADRIRSDSRARMKKLGLLAGDSYIDISPGNPRFEPLEPGSLIPAARQTNVDQLISSGEDLVDNFVQISYSMKNILSRVDRGEGLLGELTSTPETKQRITDTYLATFSSSMQNGQGLLPRLLNDKQYGDQALLEFSGLAHQLNDAVAKLNAGQGTAGKLISDPSVYESINDILIGINESKLLRWLIRNRQERGIERRVQIEQQVPPPPVTVVPATVPVTASSAV